MYHTHSLNRHSFIVLKYYNWILSKIVIEVVRHWLIGHYLVCPSSRRFTGMRAVLQCFVAPLWHTHIQPHVILSRPQNTIRLFTIYLLNLQFYNNLSLRNSVYQSGICMYSLHCRKNGVVEILNGHQRKSYISKYAFIFQMSTHTPHGYRKTCVV